LKLAVMRHGQTEWNVIHRIQGTSDIPLNEKGREQARAACERYREEHFTRAYVSPLQRARETAELVLHGHDIPIEVDERLHEMSFGPYEGDQDIVETPGHPLAVLFQAPENYDGPNGAESFEELYRRTGEFLKEKIVPLVDSDEYVLLVGHGAMNLSIMNRLRQIPIEQFWHCHKDNCETEMFEINGLEDLHLESDVFTGRDNI